MEPVELTSTVKQPSCTAQAVRSKKITSEIIQTSLHSSPADLGYIVSPTQRAAVQHQVLGPRGLCHHPPFASPGTRWRPHPGSRRRDAQSICSESTISVEKEILICFCSVRSEEIPPPLLVGRNEAIPLRRGKIALCALEEVPWRQPTVTGFARFEI